MFYIGLDLGQKKDYSAIAVLERIDRVKPYRGLVMEQLLLRHAERLPLGTPYPKVVDRVREIVRSDALRANCALAVDATGVGAPVVDMLRAARLGCDLTPVTITGGEAEGSNYRVPKRDLIAGLQVLLENGELKIARMRETARLVKELTDVRMLSRGRIGAEGEGEHDDLVIALALACWRAKRKLQIYEGTKRLPGI